ncbi:MAG: LytTR family DNA-binding domain-containing protein [Ginsengibacter sp.]
MIKIAIVDDEQHCINSLVFHLQNVFPDTSIVFQTNDPNEALQRLPEIKPDLLFLDVEMPLMNGFELLEQLGTRDFDVIFTTAYSKYAVQAFKAKAVNYLLKPVDEEELQSAVQEWKQNRPAGHRVSAQKIDDLLDYLKKEGILKNKIGIPVSDGIEFIEVNDIMYCKSQSNYTNFHLANGQQILISKTIKEVEKMLVHYFFMRVHRSFLINPNFMRKYMHHEGGVILMQDNELIPVSNPHKKRIKEIFDAIGKNQT